MKLMVAGAISYAGPLPLIVLEEGEHVDGPRYKKIIAHYVECARGKLGRRDVTIVQVRLLHCICFEFSLMCRGVFCVRDTGQCQAAHM